MNLSSVQYNLLYSVYSMPNMILPLMGGLLMDKIGYRKVFFAASAVLTVGQGFFAFGVTLRSFNIALLGRILFGIGGEILDLAALIIVVKWFRYYKLPVAVAIKGSLSFLGSLLNDNLEPSIVEGTSLDFGLWFGFLLCFISFVCTILSIILDIRRDKILGIKINKDLIEAEKFKIKDLKEFGIIFWTFLFVVFSSEASFYCFMNIASGFYVDRFEYTETEASSIMSIVYGISVIFYPIIAHIVDKVGKRISFIILSGFLLVIFHFACILTPSSHQPIYPIFYLILLGFGYCIFNSVYFSTIPYIIESKVSGSAYGMNYSILNTALVIVPVLIGYFQDNFDKQLGYFWPNVLLMGLGWIAIIASLVVYFLDRKKNEGRLQSLNPDLSTVSLSQIKLNGFINH
jgi:MFS family permease